MPVRLVAGRGEHPHVALVPHAGRHVRRLVGLLRDRAVLRVDGTPPALGLDAAVARLRPRLLGAETRAVRHLVEAVAQRLGPDPQGLEEHVVTRIASPSRRSMTDAPTATAGDTGGGAPVRRRRLSPPPGNGGISAAASSLTPASQAGEESDSAARTRSRSHEDSMRAFHRRLTVVHDNDRVRVLVIEDEAKLANVIARGLREEGYAVDIAEPRRGRALDGPRRRLRRDPARRHAARCGRFRRLPPVAQARRSGAPCSC